jgi:hypothetical protein
VFHSSRKGAAGAFFILKSEIMHYLCMRIPIAGHPLGINH